MFHCWEVSENRMDIFNIHSLLITQFQLTASWFGLVIDSMVFIILKDIEL